MQPSTVEGPFLQSPPLPRAPRFALCRHDQFTFSWMAYEWSHTVRTLLRLFFSHTVMIWDSPVLLRVVYSFLLRTRVLSHEHSTIC